MVCTTQTVKRAHYTFSTVNQSDLGKCTSGWCTESQYLAFYTPYKVYTRIKGEMRVKFSDTEAPADILVYDADESRWVNLTAGELERSIDGWASEYAPWANYPDMYCDDFVYWLRKTYPPDRHFSPNDLNSLWKDWQANPTVGCSPEDQPLWVHSDDEIGPFADDVNTGEINVGNKSDRWLILAYHEFGDGCAHDIQSACDAQGVIQDELLDRDITRTHYFFDASCVGRYIRPAKGIKVSPGEWTPFDLDIGNRKLSTICLNTIPDNDGLDFRKGKLFYKG